MVGFFSALSFNFNLSISFFFITLNSITKPCFDDGTTGMFALQSDLPVSSEFSYLVKFRLPKHRATAFQQPSFYKPVELIIQKHFVGI